MANVKMEEVEPIMVLQRRHLYKQPLEYLVKYRGSAGRFREIWIPQTALAAMDKGPSLIRTFKKTKVGQMGVDVHLGKRRSLMRRSTVAGHSEAPGSTEPVSCDVPMSASSSSTGKPKSSSKTGKESTNASTNNSSRSSDVSSKSASVGFVKSKSSASKFGTQHGKNASFSRHSFGNHRTKLLKQHSSLRHGAPSSPAKQHTFAQSKQPKRSNSETIQSEISLAITSNNGSKFSKIVENANYDDELVSVSSESSTDEVRYSLAQEHNGPSGNGRHRPGGCSTELGRKSKAAGNPSKKLRLSETDTDSVREDSEINFKHSPSNSLKNQQKFRLEQGSMSQFPNRCSWGGFSPRFLSDGLGFSDSGGRNSSATELSVKPRKKRSDNDKDDDVQIERRISVRQTENAFRFKEIVVRKCSKYMHLVTLSQTPTKNAFNPKVFHELTVALHNAVNDDCHVVLLTASGNVFSSGIDIDYLLNSEEDRRMAAKNMATSLREFISCLIAFPKPIVVAVNGPAIGLGMAILPLCDIVYASDKACFSCPYTALCQTPEGCASHTFQKMMGMAMANELLFRGRKITALEANQIGLVTQVFWPDNLMSEVTPRVQRLATQSLKVMENTKALVRSNQRSKLECVNAAECQMLMDSWVSSECQRAMKLYLEKANDLA